MRDPTRGGLAACLVELAEASGVTVELDETSGKLEEAKKVAGLANIVAIEANGARGVAIAAPQGIRDAAVVLVGAVHYT